MTGLGRCTGERACPVRFRDGRDRLCPWCEAATDPPVTQYADIMRRDPAGAVAQRRANGVMYPPRVKAERAELEAAGVT